MMRTTLIIAAIVALAGASPAPAEPLSDPHSWPYLPQCHQCVTPEIFERTGIDGRSAQILARVTKATAEDYCENFTPGRNLATCTARVLAEEADRVYSAGADCPAGILTVASGDTFRVAGIWNEGPASGRARFVNDRGDAVPVGVHSAGLPLSTQWAVLCPTVTPALGDAFARRDGAFVSIVGIDHNGSSMWVSQDLSVIYYDKPKAALRSIASGTVLYRGDPIPTAPGIAVSGTAYTFRKGCDPAPYPVTGSTTRDGKLVLKGKAPVREKGGCRVTGYTADSSNATLVFTFHYGDV